MHPLERLVNLTALMLASRRPLTFEEIRDRIDAYQQGDVASAKRMFERDKDALREVGIPVALVPTDAWDVEKGYMIDEARYYLPEIRFSRDELWALFVAAHTPGDEGEGDAERAFQKLAAGVDDDLPPAMADRVPTPGIDVSGPHLATVADALARRRRIRFTYRPAQGRRGVRHVDPYALLFRRGTWYVVGLDLDRGEIRSYRLSRIRSTVREDGDAPPPPEGFEAARYLESGPLGAGLPAAKARVAFDERIAWLVVATTPGTSVAKTRANGWVELDVPAGEPEAFASWVLSFGPDARVVSPKELRDEVLARLRTLAGTSERA